MEINSSCKLLLRNVYSYDISSCHYVILKQLDIDVSQIDEHDKLKRNTQIGMMMKDNPRLITILRSVTLSTIDSYISKNNLKDEDLILKQYDGFMAMKLLREFPDGYISLELQEVFDIFLVSIDRTKYISYDGSKVKIKGVPYRYEKMDNIFKRLAKINYSSKDAVFSALKRIKNEVLTSEDPLLYCIPVDKAGEKFTVFLKDYGEIPISKSMSSIMDVDEIDRERYFDFYIRPFTESITIELKD